MKSVRYIKMPWSKQLLVSTIISSIVIVSSAFISLCCYCFCDLDARTRTTLVLLMVVLNVSFVVAAMMAPKRIEIGDESLDVCLFGGRIRIRKDEIKKVTKFSPQSSTLRVVGIGGLFGYIGLFRNKELGLFYSYVTDFNKSYIVYREKKYPIVISADSALFL